MTTPVPAGGSSLLDSVLGKIATARSSAEGLVDRAEREHRDLTPHEVEAFDDHLARLKGLTDHRDQILARTAREDAAARSRLQTGEHSMSYAPGRVLSEPSTYRRSDPDTSYFRDLYEARNNGSREATERLVRSDRERRALSTGATEGGEFAPPGWLVDEFIKLARPGRVAADRAQHEALPSGVSSVNLPKVATGVSVDIQAQQNTALSQTDMTTNSVSSGISTIGGKQVVSMQLLQQSGLNFDTVILGDLAGEYAKQLDLQFLSGSGTGGQLRGVTGIAGTTVTYTDGSPSVGGAGKFYAQVAKALQAVETSRFAQPDAIIVHPRRWAWVLAASDTSNRPLVTPSGAGYNAVGTAGAPAAEGRVGEMLGLPVYTDPNITIADGAGTDQDIVYVGRFSDCWVYESPIQAEAFTAPYADSMGVLFRLFAYSAAIPDRYPASVAVIRGTGLVTPAF
jgi:HK97 family phage major capsid protein